MFSLICAWINGRVNNHEAGDLRRHRAHYDVIVMKSSLCNPCDHGTNSFFQDRCIVKLSTSNRPIHLHTGTNLCRGIVLYALVRKTMHGAIVGKSTSVYKTTQRPLLYPCLNEWDVFMWSIELWEASPYKVTWLHRLKNADISMTFWSNIRNNPNAV